MYSKFVIFDKSKFTVSLRGSPLEDDEVISLNIEEIATPPSAARDDTVFISRNLTPQDKH